MSKPESFDLVNSILSVNELLQLGSMNIAGREK